MADALIPVYHDQASDELLDQYAKLRRDVFVNIVNPTTQANKRRLHEFDPATVGDTDPFLRTLREADADKKQNIRAHASLAVDMSQYVNKGSTATQSAG